MDHIIECRQGGRSAPEIASAPAASELPIGGSRRVDRGPADLGPIYYRATNERREHYYSVKLSQLVELTVVE
ncbi:hypothetical protein T12_15855 [Trichinella patagoniensis]|uniref:Uncharacterized protein n=1 Tax=Trichinella patagoniensis TaxID=990121 RepID=A0A0V0XFY4_9BILA|nr:hypothetical protein T12_15855 [Trichinella patagoniensis]